MRGCTPDHQTRNGSGRLYSLPGTVGILNVEVGGRWQVEAAVQWRATRETTVYVVCVRKCLCVANAALTDGLWSSPRARRRSPPRAPPERLLMLLVLPRPVERSEVALSYGTVALGCSARHRP